MFCSLAFFNEQNLKIKTSIIFYIYFQWCLIEEIRQDAPKFVFVTVTVLNMCIRSTRVLLGQHGGWGEGGLGEG